MSLTCGCQAVAYMAAQFFTLKAWKTVARGMTGFRGAPVRDVAALEDGLLRVSALIEDIPQIAELDCNPFVVHEQGAVILDARMRVEAAAPRPLIGVRR